MRVKILYTYVDYLIILPIYPYFRYSLHLLSVSLSFSPSPCLSLIKLATFPHILSNKSNITGMTGYFLAFPTIQTPTSIAYTNLLLCAHQVQKHFMYRCDLSILYHGLIDNSSEVITLFID